MTRSSKIMRTIMAAFGLAIATPVVLAVTADVGMASGYMVSSGDGGEPICTPGGADDCP